MRVISCFLFLSLAAGCGGDDDGASAADGGAAACTATVKLKDYMLEPSSLALSSGASVICAVNDGQTPHDLRVRDGSKVDLFKTAVLAPGTTARLSVTLSAGSYEMYCSVAGHEALGMKGPVTVK